MKKFFLIIFILVDGFVVFASGWFLYKRFTHKPMDIPYLPSVMTPTSSTTTSTMTATPSSPTPSEKTPSASSTQPPTGPGRKILFTYRNSKSRKVMIRADFTGWRAEPMEKNAATNEWKYMAVLEPGEYAYCFTVDDKSIRDPFNKRTKQVGKTIVSSKIVAPLSSASK